MRLSAKSRYALAATIYMAQNYDKNESITLISISDKLNISKIYLEQVFSLLKRGGIVSSIKGSQGGYQLASPPGKITAYDILLSIETALFESVEDTLQGLFPEIETAVKAMVYLPLDNSVRDTLVKTTLEDLVNEAVKNRSGNNSMFFI